MKVSFAFVLPAALMCAMAGRAIADEAEGVVRISDRQEEQVQEMTVRGQSPESTVVQTGHRSCRCGEMCGCDPCQCGSHSDAVSGLACDQSGVCGDSYCGNGQGGDEVYADGYLVDGYYYGSDYCGRAYHTKLGAHIGARIDHLRGFHAMTTAHLREYLHCRLGYFLPTGGGGKGVPLCGRYNMVYPANPAQTDPRDGYQFAAPGYGVPVSVPLAPNVPYTYNYSWGVPSSRLTPINHLSAAP